jgi:hypothetical protein
VFKVLIAALVTMAALAISGFAIATTAIVGTPGNDALYGTAGSDSIL